MSNENDFRAAVDLWADHMTHYGSKHAEALIANQDDPNADIPLFATYYDATRVFYQIADYTGDARYIDAALAANHVYRDRYVKPNNGGAAGHWIFPHGLAEHYRRTGDQESKDQLILLSNNAAGTQDYLPVSYGEDVGGSRELAYCLMSYLQAESIGAPHRPRTEPVATAALGHIEQWTIPDPRPKFLYIRPFLVGLTCEALIEYEAQTGDPRVLPAVKSALDWMWEHCWLEENQVFSYTDIETSQYVEVSSGTVASVASAAEFSGNPELQPWNDFYNAGPDGTVLTFKSGVLAGQAFNVSKYTGNTRTFTLAAPMPQSPAPGDTFTVTNQVTYFGTIQSAESRTRFIGDQDCSPIDNFYNHGSLIFLTGSRAGEGQQVKSYVGPTRQFTITDFWSPGGTQAPGDRFLVRSGSGSTGGREPGGDLSMLVAHAFGWVYLKTGDTIYRDRGDRVWAGGVRTAYLDGPKQFNQSYKSSFLYLKYRDEADRKAARPETPPPGPKTDHDGPSSATLAARIDRLETWARSFPGFRTD